MTLPAWVAEIAALDDDALAAASNKGLVRRAARAVDRIVLSATGPDDVRLACDGATIRLLPGGVGVARCDCPVAGVCVHIVAACLWTRTQDIGHALRDDARHPGGELSLDGDGGHPSGTGGGVGRSGGESVLGGDGGHPLGTDVGSGSGLVVGPRGARDPGSESSLGGDSGHPLGSGPGLLVGPRDAGYPGGESWLGGDGGHSSGTGGGVGLTGVEPSSRATPTPESEPASEAVGGSVVEGGSDGEPHHGSLRDSSVPADTASRRPEASSETSGGRRGQRIVSKGAAADLAAIIESLVADGVSQLAPASVDRLARAGERARLDDLGLLARIAAQAVGNLRSHLRRDDTVTESDCLSALAQAWQLACILADDPEPPPELVGARTRKGEQADVGELMPLAVRWWRNPDGARGLRLHAFDLRHGRLEEATNGRAAGADPGFQPGWNLSLLWGVSPSVLSSGVLSLTGAERRPDGTLSATGRTRVEARLWGDLDLAELARRVNALSDGPARTAFGATPEPLRLVVPRSQFGLGAIEVDEVAQKLVWPIVDENGRVHRLTLPASEYHGQLLTWMAQHRGLRAITVIGSQPEAVFVREKGEIRLVSLTLSRLEIGDGVPSLIRRLFKRDQHRRAAPTPTPPSELVRLCDACADVVDALGATGRRSLTPRQTQTLSARATQADDLGLATLAAALRAILASPSPSSILWARFILDRLGQLVS